MEFWKKKGRKAFAKHLRNKQGKWTKRMANSKSRRDAKKEMKKGGSEFEILKARLEEAILLKREGKYLNRDFDSLVDAL
jgi:hypothetical protein